MGLNLGLGIARRLRRVATFHRGRKTCRIEAGVGAGLWFRGAGAGDAYGSGTNELPVQEALRRTCNPGDVFFDIGANVGFFTMIGARLVGTQGLVVAFEPIRSNAQAVRTNAELNAFTHVRVREEAVADQVGHVEMYATEHVGGATLCSTGIAPADTVRRVRVAQVSIDALIGAGKLPAPNVVKIDVEGAELAVVDGMAGVLDRHRPIVVYEVDDAEREAFETRTRSVEHALTAHGYRIERLEDAYPGIAWCVGHAIAWPG